MHFPSSYDRRSIIMTSLVVALLGMVGVSLFNDADYSPALRWTIVLGIGSAVAGIFGFSLRRITVDERAVRLQRWLFGARVIPIGQIAQARLVLPGETSGSLRLLGNGGLFGWFGIFSNPQFGRYTVLATRSDRLVALRLQNKQVVLFSADDPAAVLEALAQRGAPVR